MRGPQRIYETLMNPSFYTRGGFCGRFFSIIHFRLCLRVLRSTNEHAQVVASSPGTDGKGSRVSGQFRKRYDAYPAQNALGGTCALGQLLDEGYEQEEVNGL